MTRRFVLSIIILFLGIQLLAQEQTDFSSLNVIDYKKPNDYIIKDITISGVKYLDKNILITLSGLTIQRQITIPGEDITRAVEKLWKQGLFSDIKIKALNLYLGLLDGLTDH